MTEDANRTETETPESSSPARFITRAILAIYLVTLPACTHDIGHFGPGFFPFLAALILVPMFAVVSTMEAGSAWAATAKREGLKSKLFVALAMSVVALGYWFLIARVIIEKAGT